LIDILFIRITNKLNLFINKYDKKNSFYSSSLTKVFVSVISSIPYRFHGCSFPSKKMQYTIQPKSPIPADKLKMNCQACTVC